MPSGLPFGGADAVLMPGAFGIVLEFRSVGWTGGIEQGDASLDGLVLAELQSHRAFVVIDAHVTALIQDRAFSVTGDAADEVMAFPASHFFDNLAIHLGHSATGRFCKYSTHSLFTNFLPAEPGGHCRGWGNPGIVFE
jgi:hypothetical protein